MCRSRRYRAHTRAGVLVQADTERGQVLLTCQGVGFANLSKKIQ